MEINPDNLKPREMYEWLVHTILPRPIAWVSTVSNRGIANLAPFSFFAGVCARPPTLMFCPVNDRHGNPKDTLRNIEANGEFVVNLVPNELAESMNSSSASLPHEDSEFDRFSIASAPSHRVKPARVSGVPVAFECVLDRIVRISDGPIGGNAVFGRIVHFHVADSVLAGSSLPTPESMDLIGRLGGSEYVRLRDRFEMQRPE